MSEILVPPLRFAVWRNASTVEERAALAAFAELPDAFHYADEQRAKRDRGDRFGVAVCELDDRRALHVELVVDLVWQMRDGPRA